MQNFFKFLLPPGFELQTLDAASTDEDHYIKCLLFRTLFCSVLRYSDLLIFFADIDVDPRCKNPSAEDLSKVDINLGNDKLFCLTFYNKKQLSVNRITCELVR